MSESPATTPDLYYYDERTDSLQYIPEPSPYITEYYTFDEPTQTFGLYRENLSYNAGLYTYNEGTASYQQVAGPEPQLD
jgi:hypothetical protein